MNKLGINTTYGSFLAFRERIPKIISIIFHVNQAADLWFTSSANYPVIETLFPILSQLGNYGVNVW